MSASNIENCLIRAGHDRRIIVQFHPRPEYLGTLSVAMQGSGVLPDLRYRLSEGSIPLPPLRDRRDLAALLLRFAKAARPDADLAPGLPLRLAGYHWPGNLNELRAVMHQAARRRTRGMITEADLAGLIPLQPPPAAAVPCPTCTGIAWKEIQCFGIQRAVSRQHGNIARAARDLGMSRTTVYKHIARV